MKNLSKLLFWLLLINCTTLFSQSEYWNLDFEEWNLENTTPDLWYDTTIVQDRMGLFPPKWHFHPDFIHEGRGLGRTTDATTGDYAVALSGFYQYQIMRIISGEDPVNSGWPINFKPNKFHGDYKAILLGDCDSLRTYVDVYLTNYNQTQGQRDTIGQANLILNETNLYSPFEMDIHYSNEMVIPDTVIVILAKERFGFDNPPNCLECGHVFFDNLRFTPTVSSTSQNRLYDSVKILPNPTSQYISFYSFCENCQYNTALFSSTGQLIKTFEIIENGTKIYINGFSAGLYYLRIEEASSGEYTFKKIVIEN